MKKFKVLFIAVPILAILVLVFVLNGIIIQNPSPEDCETKELMVTRIYEGGVKDIVFANASGDFYYINRGLEQGFTLEAMEAKVLNKKVTLHLANTLIGSSNHIAQLAVDNEVIFTEF